MSERLIVLDTETTGIDNRQHRIIEIGALTLIDRQVTDHFFHRYINPERDIDPAAQAVHGITLEFLLDKPREEDILEDFLAFIRDGHLLIHNSPFDVGFLNAMLARHHYPPLTTYCEQITDTLAMARKLHPGKKNSLDALCERYQVNTEERTKHSALVDVKLLAQVYLRMTRGQESLDMHASLDSRLSSLPKSDSKKRPLIQTSHSDQLEHRHYIHHMIEKNNTCLWKENAEEE